MNARCDGSSFGMNTAIRSLRFRSRWLRLARSWRQCWRRWGRFRRWWRSSPLWWYGPETNHPLIFEDFVGRVVAWGAHDSAARMRSGPAHIEPVNGCAITRASRYRAHYEHLIQGHFAVEDIPSREAEA